MMIKNGMRPIRPGEILREDYLKPLGMSASALASALRVPALAVAEQIEKKVLPHVA
ncbi:MAG TPA: hypothetical protein PKE36_02010 [Chiayiivirga sp.]|nr:hypothetical protein [Chiayiivirga sp.]